MVVLDPLPEGCPSEAVAIRAMTQGLSDEAPARVHGTVTHGPRGFAMTLTIHQGERRLEAPTCRALLDAAGVVVAMSGSREDPVEPPPAKVAPAPSPAVIAPEPPRDVAARASSEPRTAAVLRAFATGNGGTLPSFTFGAGAAVGVTRGWIRGELAGAIYAGQDGFVDPDRGAHFSLAEVAARVCVRAIAAVPVEPCAGLAVMRVGATGFGARSVSDTSALVWGPEASLDGALEVSEAWAVRLGVGAMVPTSRPGFEITGRGTVHELAPVAFRASIGPEVRF